MPIYEYLCSSCGHEEDLLQKASERPKRKCPACGRLTLKKKISLPSFRLKGTGWYETDFKNKGKPETKTGDKAGTEAAGDAGKPGDGKPQKEGKAADAASGKSASSDGNKKSAA